MKTKIILLATATLAATLVRSELTPVHPSRMAEFNKRTGGMIDPPSNSRQVVVIDARQDRAVSFTNNLKIAARLVEFPYDLRETTLGKGDSPLALARAERKNEKAAAVLFYYEDDTMPVLSVYPEEAITLVNVRPLFDKDENVYRRRFNKEFWRALSFMLGGYGGATQGATVLAPVFSLGQLDDLRTMSLTPNQINAIMAGKKRLNIYGGGKVPYSRACREGWAPKPTNDVQKAIWEKVHAIPDKPMKIEFDPATQKGKVTK